MAKLLQEYQQKKEAAANRLIERLKKLFPKLDTGLDYIEIGTARTHCCF
jgi:prolycopene isomerase